MCFFEDSGIQGGFFVFVPVTPGDPGRRPSSVAVSREAKLVLKTRHFGDRGRSRSHVPGREMNKIVPTPQSWRASRREYLLRYYRC